MATLSLKGINKIYDNNVQAVFDFNLDIKDKEFIVFVGPSGCGKSTTLRMVAGLEEITSGQLYIDGRMVNSVAPKDRDIAMVFQNYALYPHMTVYENMAFALKLRKIALPLYTEENEEIACLKEHQKEVWKKVDALNRKFKKKQNNLDILPERAKLYEEIYDLDEKINKLRTPIYGKEEYRIALLKNSAKELTKEIEKYEKYLDSKFAEDENNVKIIKTGIDERNTQIAKINEEIKYYENNDVPLTKLRHLTKREIEIEINKTAESIDLIRYLYRKPAALSGGQRQRVALGRAIVRKPKVFLMDEPLSNLDAKLRVQTRTSITKIHERVGATTIYVTHDQTEAMTMADRIVIMKDGYIQQIGTPEEVYNDPANKFVGGFIGSPSMNFINVEIKDGKAIILKKHEAQEAQEGEEGVSKRISKNDPVLELSKDVLKLLKDYEGKKVVVGIRPEDVYLEGDKNNEHPGKKNEIIVNQSELLGSEIIVYSELNGQRIVLETSAKAKIKNMDKISICFDNSKIYLFDFETEQRIK